VGRAARADPSRDATAATELEVHLRGAILAPFL
jgi:hypothetical protein